MQVFVQRLIHLEIVTKHCAILRNTGSSHPPFLLPRKLLFLYSVGYQAWQLWSTRQIYHAACFVIKVLLEQGHAYSFMYYLS